MNARLSAYIGVGVIQQVDDQGHCSECLRSRDVRSGRKKPHKARFVVALSTDTRAKRAFCKNHIVRRVVACTKCGASIEYIPENGAWVIRERIDRGRLIPHACRTVAQNRTRVAVGN